MKYPPLMILYGRFQEESNPKQQRMIDGGSTCMYRELAHKFGHIVYLAPQKTEHYWDSSVVAYNGGEKCLERHLKAEYNKELIIWSVKKCPKKDELLSRLSNKKVYYSCCSRDMYNGYCDVSLVDTEARLKGNAKLWTKGKDPDYWFTSKLKVYDFLLVGPRNDKNEMWFIKQMEQTNKQYNILWIGGKKFEDKIRKSKHHIHCTEFLTMGEVRRLIPTAKIGIMLSEHPSEGFPQTLLEMMMCGVVPIYLDDQKQQTVYTKNCIRIKNKLDIVKVAEYAIDKWTIAYSMETRIYAIDHFSLELCYQSILRGLGNA